MTSPRRRLAGIDVGGTKCLAVVVDHDGSVSEVARQETPRDPRALLDVLASMVRALGGVDSVGIGVPGLVTRDGTIRASPNLFDVRDLPVRAELSDRLNRDVHVENDATCAAIAEWMSGAAVGSSDAIVVTLGTGIGGGLIVDGRVLRGVNGFAGEIGHMIIDPSGPPCPCGRNGCWERFASGSALATRAREVIASGRGAEIVAAAGSVDAVRGEHVERAASAGDPDARAIVTEFCRWVALGLANLTNALDPSLFVIGGGLARTGNTYISSIRHEFSEVLYAPTLRPHPAIEVAHHGELAGAIGAAYLPVVEADLGHGEQ